MSGKDFNLKLASDISSYRLLCDTSTGEIMEDLGVIVDNDFICETGSMKLPKQYISKITFKYGFLSVHPILQIILGSIASIIGIFPLYHMIFFQIYGGVFYIREVFIVSFFIIGGYLILSAFNKGSFLEIKTAFGNKRIIFVKGAEKSRIDNLLNYARNLGYPIFHDTD